jgi:hypothetical protein
MHVRSLTSKILIGALISILGQSPVLLASEPNGEGETEAASATLKQQLLTDDKIAELCRASIANKYDMVDITDENGAIRRIPRCVANYEAMRTVAEGYLNEEAAAEGQIVEAINLCTSNPDQAACLEAGRTLASKAAEMHDSLSRNAAEAQERLAAAIAIHQ